MSMSIPDAVDVFTAVGAIVAGLFAFTKWRHELAEQRALRERELRWRQAEAARKLLDDLGDSSGAQHAFTMMDWDEVEYDIGGGRLEEISEVDYKAALRVDNLRFDDKEAFIRNCFDNLFENMTVTEHHLRTGLVVFDDVRFPYDYYLPTINRNRKLFDAFLAFYELDLAAAFLRRLDKALGAKGKARPTWKELEAARVGAGSTERGSGPVGH